MTDNSYWPLYKISEPHPTNDVLLPSRGEEPLAEWLERIGSQRHPPSSTDGASIFLLSLEGRQDDFEHKTRLEQPLVTLDLLRQWRQQIPPGRFLMETPQTRPPLYEDVGDRKARAFISRVLKYLVKEENKADVKNIQSKVKISLGEVARVPEASSDVPTTPRREHLTKPPDVQPAQPKNPRSFFIGREKELDQLHSVYEAVRSREQNNPAVLNKESQVSVFFISGPAGVGKSSLVKTLRYYQSPQQVEPDDDDYLSREPPLVLHATRRIPSVLEYCSPKNEMMANTIKDFCHQLLDGDKRHLLETYRRRILHDLDEDDIEELTTLVPLLGTVLYGEGGSSSSMSDFDMTSSARTATTSSLTDELLRISSNIQQKEQQRISFFATQRPMILIGRFIRALASVSSQPLVMFMHGIYGSWEAYFKFMKGMSKHFDASVLFVATFSNDTSDSKYMHFSEDLFSEHPGVKVCHLELENLNERDTSLLISHHLNGASVDDDDSEGKLSSWIFSRAKGHPQFTLEILQYLKRKNLLTFDGSLRQWEYESQRLNGVIKVSVSSRDLYQMAAKELDVSAKETLRIAAYLCNPFINTDLLKLLTASDDVEMHLEAACESGLIFVENSSSGFYNFTSNAIHKAVYDLLPEEERESFHFNLAQRLWSHVDNNANDPEFLSNILKQFMMSDSLVKAEDDRRAIAALCLQVGQGAAKSIGFVTAWKCICHGLSILETQKKWGAKNYDLTLRIYNLAIELCYCNTVYSKLDDLINEVLSHARSFEDSLVARSTQIYSLGSQDRQDEAIEICLETLNTLGESFSRSTPTRFQVFWGYLKVKKMLGGMKDDDILNLPKMKDTKKLAAMNILNNTMLYMFFNRPHLGALATMQMVKLTLKHGLCALSSIAFTLYGVLISCDESLVDESFRYGRLALKIYDKFKTEVWLCRISAGFYGSLYTKKYSFRDCIEPLRHAHRVGIRTGDIEFAVVNACLLCWNIAEITPIPELERHHRELASEVEQLGQTLQLTLLKPMWQFLRNLLGYATGDPKELKGELIDEDMKLALSGENKSFLLWARFYSMQLAYLFGDFDLAERYSDTCVELYDNPVGAVDIAYALFYECLVLLAQARKGKRRLRHMSYVRSRVKRIRRWSIHSPINFLGKQMLLEAELAALGGKHAKALTFYRSSILHLKEGGFLLVSAIANELLGKYLLATNDKESAGPCLQKAYDLYKDWGGTTKVQHFEKELADLLTSVSPEAGS